MDGFSTYKYYLAMKFHFTVKGYDVFKHQGRVRANQKNYEEKNLRVRMEQLGRRFSSAKDAVSFFLACNLYDADVFNDSDATQAHAKWKKRTEMMTQFILDELSDVRPSLEPLSIAKLVSGGQLSYETAVALNRSLGIAQKIQEDFIYSKIGDKITKLDKFVRYDESKIEKFIQEEYGQTA